MNQITYLLGAGASYGERSSDNKIIRGLPIVSEFENSIEQTLGILSSVYNKTTDYTVKEYIHKINVLLNDLSDKCKEYPTIDTYAKMLYVTKKQAEYEKLKISLSIFLLLIQYFGKRDLRYDGFIASLIDTNCKFPSVNILSWNYDAQFEMAYKDYSINNKYLLKIWKDLNVMCKNFYEFSDYSDRFSFIKLNGTAFFEGDNKYQPVIDFFDYASFRNEEDVILGIGRIIDNSILYRNLLSFSWEKIDDGFIHYIHQYINATRILVVIGYSFPYVNREIDRLIINQMLNLSEVFIQSPNASEVKESLEAILDERQLSHIKFTLKSNSLSQFFIPRSL